MGNREQFPVSSSQFTVPSWHKAPTDILTFILYPLTFLLWSVVRLTSSLYPSYLAPTCPLIPYMIYLSLMRTFLKVIVLLFLLTLIVGVMVYSINKDTIHETIRTSLSKKLSEITGYDISIGSVKYLPIETVSLENVTLRDPSAKGSIIADVNNITLVIDLKSVLLKKQLLATAYIDGLSANGILATTTLRTISAPAADYKDVFNPDLIYSVSILKGVAAARGVTLKDVIGILKIRDLEVTEGKVHIAHNNSEFLLDFKKTAEPVTGYDISLRSKDLGLTCNVSEENNIYNITDLEGVFHNLHFYMDGRTGELDENGTIIEMNGSIETDLSTVSSLPGDIGLLTRNHRMSGKIFGGVNLTASGTDIASCNARLKISGNDIRLDDATIRKVTASATLTEGRLDIPDIKAILYGGTLTASLRMDLSEKNLPYVLSADMKNIDYGVLMLDLTGNKEQVSGILNADVSLEGYALLKDTTKGSGSLVISDADLGPMPILTPLLGDMYVAVRNTLPENKRINITQAYVDFEVRDEKIITDDLTFLGDEIYVSGSGHMYFNGDLDFEFENYFREGYSEESDDWQITLRNTIINIGKAITKTRLRGNIRSPEWGI